MTQSTRNRRSNVIAEDDGSLGSICICQATGAEAVRKHAHRVGMPADVIETVAEPIVIRPDPAREGATS
jgi:hypothetical protein